MFNLFRTLTLERLALSHKDKVVLTTLSSEQRQALYRWFTIHLFCSANAKDKRRTHKLRSLFLKDTRTKKNDIPEDTKMPLPLSDHLPSVYDPDSKDS